jgi:ABC-type sugar transport system ATPase subunit
MNLIAGEVVNEDGGPCFRSARISIALPDRFGEVPPGRTTLGIRPEHVRAQRGGDAAADLELPVRLVEPLGKDTLLYFDIGAERPFIAVSEGLAMAEMKTGDRVGLTLTRECIYLFGADGKRMVRSAARAATAPAQLETARA